MPEPASQLPVAPPAPTKPRHVVIVGGGFGGLTAAKRLARGKDPLKITVLDRHNYHLFQPLLYQVATAGLSPGEIATPLRTVLAEHENAQVLLADVCKIDLAGRQVETDIGNFPYDYLVLACGAQHSYFGHEEWEPYAPGLKTLEQATEIRRRVLLAFETAESIHDTERERELLTFVIIGGGPTGVEIAGALGEITRFTLSRDFRHIDPTRARIILIEAGPRILPAFSEDLSQRATRDLEQLGVTIWTNSKVTDITQQSVALGQEVVRAGTIIWAAGVKPSHLNKELGTPLDRAGRVIVEPDLSLPGQPNVFVLGDQACFIENGKPLPGLAPVAMQQGRAVARNIRRDIEGRPREAFHYNDRGQMAAIGRRRAVIESGQFHLAGFAAWLGWLTVHIYYLIGFKNRLIVLIQWAWAYLTFKRGAQLIVNKEWRSFDECKLPEPGARPAYETSRPAGASPSGD